MNVVKVIVGRQQVAKLTYLERCKDYTDQTR